MNQRAPSVDAAMDLIANGRAPAAEAMLEGLLAADTHSAPVLHALGLARYLQGRYHDSLDPLLTCVKLAPGNAYFRGNLAEALRRAGRLDEALAAFDEAILLLPENLKSHLGLANTLRDLGRHREAVARFRIALAMDPKFAEGYLYLGLTYVDLGRAADALPVIRKALSLRPDYVEAQSGLALALEKNGDTEQAIAVYEQLRQSQPTNKTINNNLGNLLKNMGRLDEATALYNAVLENDPDHAAAYYNLSRTQQGGDSDRLAHMEGMLESPELQGDARTNLHFALGKVYDDLGRYDEAFHHFHMGNLLDERPPQYVPEHLERLVNGLIRVFTKDVFATREGFGSDSELPVFILGMPRSGTTLVEQTLASHPRIHGAGELGHMNQLSLSLRRAYRDLAPYPDLYTRLDAVNACALGEQVVAAMRTLAGIDAGSDAILHITDKMPGNFTHMGLLGLVLPRARIIHCRRDPLDTCLSCFFQRFTAVLPYSRDLNHLGHYYRQYRRLMDHWEAVHPNPMMAVDYVDMVRDHEGTTRRILDFLGLDWDPACLDFHATKRPVRTASNWQVRQPIYDRSVARWQHYAAHIGPLREALGLPADEAAAPAAPGDGPEVAAAGRAG
ncbi:MAG: sulfotransferase, partial [Rhodobacterales bacterium]|nr:sulfotransferase [Rhodobacterales bacterium]